MHRRIICYLVAGALVALTVSVHAAPRKTHSVGLGSLRKVPYSKAGDPAGALPGEDSLGIRPLVVDGQIEEWTTGEAHDITDRSFVVRRVQRINNELPGEKPEPGKSDERWVWQRGPWLLVERTSGRVTALKLPDYSPGVSQVVWFRDYGAYCGVTASGKSLYAVVAQLAVRKPVLSRKLSAFDDVAASEPVCGAPQWQRKPLQVTFFPSGRNSVNFQIVPGSTAFIEDTSDESDAGQAAKSIEP